MALRVTVAVPGGYASSVDTVQVKKVFPYGQCNLEIVEGGGAFSSGIALPALQVGLFGLVLGLLPCTRSL